MNSSKAIFSNPLRVPSILIALSIMFVFIPGVSLLSLLLLLATMALLFPLPRFGLLTRLALSVTLFSSSNAIIGLLAWVAGLELSPIIVIILYNLVLIALLIVRGEYFSNIILKQRLFTKIEVFAFFFGFTLFVLLLKPLSHGSDATSLIRILTFTDDNTAHVSLVMNINHYQNYLHGNEEVLKNGIASNNTAYPQGWHLNTSLVERLSNFGNKAISARSLLLDYYIIAAFWVGLLGYLFCVTVYHLARTVSEKLSLVAVIIATIALGGKIFSTTIIPLFTWGAHPQIASYSLLLSIILVLTTSLSSDIINKKILVGLALIYAIGLSFFYYFELPMVFGFLALFLLLVMRTRISSLVRNREHIIYVFLLMLSIVPILIYIHYINTGQNSVLNAAGGTLSYNNLLVASLALFAALYAFQKKSRELCWVGLLLVSAVLFMAAIMTYQMLQSGSLHYYAFKASQTVVVLSVLILCVLLTDMLSMLFANRKSYLPFPVLACILILSSTLYAAVDRAQLTEIYIRGNPYGLSRGLAEAVYTASQGKHPERVITTGSCSSFFDVRAMRMIIALSGRTTASQTHIADAQFDPANSARVYSLIEEYQKTLDDKKLIIYSSSRVIADDLLQAIPASANKLNVIPVEWAADTQSCPLRLVAQ